MPNWKKLLSSGSSGSLAHLSVDTSVKATTFTGSLLRLDENGTGLRLTNVGAFENSGGDFHIFATATNLKFSTEGDSNERLRINANAISGSVPFSGSFVGDGSQLTGITADGTISGSAQVDITQTTGYSSFSSSIQTYTDAKVASLVDSAPGTLDTLNELAAALNDDPNFSASIATSIGNRLLTSSFNTYSGSAAGALRTEYKDGDSALSASAHTQREALKYTDAKVKAKLNADGVISGSSSFISSSGNLTSGELVYSTGTTSLSSSNLIYLDTANERVGIKTTSPQYPFHYVQDTGNALAVYEKENGAAIFYEAQDTRGVLGTVGLHPLLFAIDSYEVSRINTDGVYEGDVSGSIYATNGVISGSSQVVLSSVDGYSTYSSSVQDYTDAKITALSSSADTHLDAKITALSSSVDAHLDANITALSSSVDAHLDAKK